MAVRHLPSQNANTKDPLRRMNADTLIPLNPIFRSISSGKTVARLALPAGCAFLLMGALAYGVDRETVFEDNFDGHLVDAAPGDPWVVAESEGAGAVRVLQDEEDVFGKGSGNRFLEFRADGTEGSLAFWAEEAFEAEVASIRFQFVEAEAPEFPDFSWIILYAGSRSTGNRAQVIDFGQGTLGNSAAYEKDVVNEVELVVNNSTMDMTYGDGHFLEAGRTDIWINGALAQAGFSAQNNQRGAVTGFEINISGSRRQLLLLDDLVVQSLTPEFIEPEPLIILEDDFTGHFPNSIPGAPWTLVFDGPGIGSIRARADTGDLFGKGTSNHYLEYRKDGTDGSMALRSLGTIEAVLSTFSFRYIETTDFEDFTWLILYAGSRSTGNRVQVINFGRDGHLGEAAERGVINQVDIIVNNSDDPVTYLGFHTVAPGSADIWVNGQLANDDFSAQNNRRGPVTGFELNTSGARTQRLFVDELVVRNYPFVTGYEPGERPFDVWRATYFSPEELEDPAISGPEADASGDGVANLVAYGLDLNPRTVAPRHALPAAGFDEEGLTLTYTRVKGATDIRYVVEVSGDLMEWDTGEELVEEIDAIDQGETEQIVVLDILSRDSDPARRFMRLLIELL